MPCACAPGGCRCGETLNVRESLRPGTGAIRRECRMHSRLSAPQGSVLETPHLPRSAGLPDVKCLQPHQQMPGAHAQGMAGA